MKIAIVNDLASVVSTLRRIVQIVLDYKVIWTAQDGVQAVAKCAQNTPDLILMDLDMPLMDGVEATRQIMKISPCAILIVTANAKQNVGKVYAAMEYGALDVADIPVLNHTDNTKIGNELLVKIARIGKLLKQPSPKMKGNPLTQLPHWERSNAILSTIPLIAIGSSTGGPKALATILSQLPTNFGATIAIVQHVDVQFSAGFIDWLSQQTRLPVRMAQTGDRLEKGIISVASTNDHLYLKPDLSLGYTQEPIDYSYRPSVDVFFKSLAQHWRGKGTAVLLTGMGRDGAEGLSALKIRGWHTIAQDKDSCVVYGMPKAAVELNAAVEILSLEEISTTLLKNVPLNR
jgi:two-component system response regulator WspF